MTPGVIYRAHKLNLPLLIGKEVTLSLKYDPTPIKVKITQHAKNQKSFVATYVGKQQFYFVSDIAHFNVKKEEGV